MRGVIFQELQDFVRRKLGRHAWVDLLKAAGVETTLYAPVQSYPDKELISLVTSAARRLGLSTDAVLEEFGKYLGPAFVKKRAYLLNPEWDYLDIFAHLGDIIKQVASLQPHPDSDVAELSFICTRDSPTQLTMHYNSPRKYCFLWKGCMKGVAQHLGLRIEIEEPVCLHQGDDECEIILKVLGPVDASLSDAEISEAPTK